MNTTLETFSEFNDEFNDELNDARDYDAAYDFDRNDLESDDECFGADLAFCSPAFREIFN